MNKDLDSRIIPNGEYRNAENVSVSTSEGSDVGALENIRGNIKIADFGLTGHNLEIIGHCVDTANNRIFFFITNFSGELGSTAKPGGAFRDIKGDKNWVKSGGNHYICYAQVDGDAIDVNSYNVGSRVLVSGSFLNFSTVHPILGVNIIEDLLFWTDDRNQPRKINIKTAIANPYQSDTNKGYYTHEDHISVAKYAPYTSISFIKDTNSPGPWGGATPETTLKNEVDEFLPPFVLAPGSVVQDVDTSTNSILEFNSIVGKDNSGNNLKISDFLNSAVAQDMEEFNPKCKVTITSDPNGSEAFVYDCFDNKIRLKTSGGSLITDIPTTLGWKTTDKLVYQFSIANPDYNIDFKGDKDLLREKFVRFSYRFKYDDGEYSLTAPFSQHAFVPKNYGYFIGDDDEATAESSIVDFMENQITTAGLVLDLPYQPNELLNKLHVNELQLLYKASDEQSLKVISDIDVEGLKEGLPYKIELTKNGDTGLSQGSSGYTNVTGGSGSNMRIAISVNANGTVSGVINNQSGPVGVSSQGEGYRINDIVKVGQAEFKITELDTKYFYNYKSQKPIKVLPEKEIVRVSDIVPIRAKTQEVVGNRVVYGNFLQNKSTPSSLDYEVRQIDKGSDTGLKYNQELLNHTLKQGRTYQAGIVLQDRYGRSSNVIVNSANSSSTEFNSTYFSPYTNGGVDPLSWPGNSLYIVFNEKIKTTSSSNYSGAWDEDSNPLGWYTYKVVVKQQEQDYYNIYVPGSLTGNVVFTGYSKGDYPSGGSDSRTVTPLAYSGENKVAHIALFNDNINKIPRDLNEVGPSDTVYSSSVVLYNRVNNRNVSSSVPGLSQQTLNVGKQEVNSVRPFGEMGDWTKYKNVNLHYLNMDPSTSATPRSQYPNPTFIYPGSKGDIDPFFLDNNKNPLIATLKIDKRIGATADQQGASNYVFSKELTIFETKPVKSQLDIYYETSTSGTVLDFNNGIDTDQSLVTMSGVTPIQSTGMIESLKTGTSELITNVFQVTGSNGLPMADSSIEVVIKEVKNSVGNNGTDITEFPFDIVDAVPPQGTSQQAQWAFYRKEVMVYKSDSDQKDNYNVTIKATSDTDATGIEIPNINLKLTNIPPIIDRINMGSKKAKDWGSSAVGNGLICPVSEGDRRFITISRKYFNDIGRERLVGFINKTSNGSVTSFTGVNEVDDTSLPQGQEDDRLTELNYVISSVSQEACDLTKSTGCIGSTRSFAPMPRDFRNNFILEGRRILFKTDSNISTSDIPPKSSGASSKVRALVFRVFIRAIDANGGVGSDIDDYQIRVVLANN